MEQILRGTVFHQHEQKPIFSVQLANGDYTVVSITATDKVNFGDIISGPLDKEGSVMLHNETSLANIQANILHVYCTKVEALQRTMMV